LWIRRIPEMLEALELAVADRIDRQAIEELFDLRKTAPSNLLRQVASSQPFWIPLYFQGNSRVEIFPVELALRS
jgi:hypothetical protein